MKKQLLKVIENAIHSDKQLFPLNQSWIFLHQEYNIGHTQGNNLQVTLQDKDNLIAIVKFATGIDLGQISVTDFAAMNREEALFFALNEKIAGQAVKKDRLAIKTLAGHTLKINDHSYSLPGCGYLDMALTDISSTAHHCILLIENYRCFDNLENIQLNLPDQYADPLVLYRGDNFYSEKTVRQLLVQFNLSVLVMADLDPQGLIIAQSFSGIVGLIAPRFADLEILFKDKQKANPSLYEKQMASCQHALSHNPHPLIRQLWKMMKVHQAGLVQEYWLQAGYELVVHSLDLSSDE
ncbi:DUF7281 domain-containing protein [Methylobacter psychrophilus]|uniref:DUF7281 domain-containing protein n=1 Tax=Methylobacter psychrophilus TaxID=96941 RepID=UPI0021D51697|nr:hypothetical protein [Methylobacter psychrophilus]